MGDRRDISYYIWVIKYDISKTCDELVTSSEAIILEPFRVRTLLSFSNSLTFHDLFQGFHDLNLTIFLEIILGAF